MSSPQMTRMLGFLLASAMSLSLSVKWTNVKNHARGGRETDEQQDQGYDQHQRNGKVTLRVDQLRCLQLLALVAQAEHEQHVVHDPENQHANAEQHERRSEIARRRSGLDDAGLLHLVEELIDGEAEADERQRGTD